MTETVAICIVSAVLGAIVGAAIMAAVAWLWFKAELESDARSVAYTERQRWSRAFDALARKPAHRSATREFARSAALTDVASRLRRNDCPGGERG